MTGLPGGWEWIIILFVVLLLFGSKKLPELARSIGKSISEFKKGKDDAEKDHGRQREVEGEIPSLQEDVPGQAAQAESPAEMEDEADAGDDRPDDDEEATEATGTVRSGNAHTSPPRSKDSRSRVEIGRASCRERV